MNRDKIFELMLQVGCSKYCNPKNPELEGFIVNDSVLDRIVALIEREVRGDAEPVAWMSPKKERLEFSRADTVYGSHTIPLYTHPAPAVVRQLVGALEQLMSIVKIHSRATSNNFAWAEMDFAKEALAAAKEAGI